MSRSRHGLRAATVALAIAALAGPSPAAAGEPILLCEHASYSGGSARAADYLGMVAYFEGVNAGGGIDGHPVHLRFQDDGSTASAAIAAAEACRSDGGTLAIGAISDPEAIVAVARWSETEAFPYLHESVAFTDAYPSGFSGFIGPPHEEQMQQIAAMIAANSEGLGIADGGTIAIVTENTATRQAGRRAFVDALATYGYTPSVDRSVNRLDGMASVAAELKAENAVAVVAFMSAVPFVRLALAAQSRDHRPAFFALSPEIASNALSELVEGSIVVALHAPAPPFDPENDPSPWQDEVDRFRDAYRTYVSDQHAPDDAEWGAWLRARRIHGLLDSLDGDFSPSGISMALSGYAEEPAASYPSCPLRFVSGVGAHSWNVVRAIDGGWTTLTFCGTGAGLSFDRVRPAIDCGSSLEVASEVRCTITDTGSGVGGWRIEASGISGTTTTSGDGSCLPEAQASADLPAGAYVVDVYADDCEDLDAEPQRLHRVSLPV